MHEDIGATKVEDSDHHSMKKSAITEPYTSSGVTLQDLNLSEMEQQQLHGRQNADSEDMSYKFQKLFTSITKSLQDRDITASDLTRHLLLMGSIPPTFNDSGQPQYLRHRLLELSKARNIDAAMFIIKDYCSFFNYRMLEHIINELGTEQDKLNLKEYKDEFAKYGKRYIFECSKVIGKMSGNGNVTMIVTLDDTFDNCTVNHIHSFVDNLRKILSIPSNNNIMTLKLCRVEPGSVKLIFQLPDFVCQSIFPLTGEQEAELVSAGIIELSCGDHRYLCQGTTKVSSIIIATID